MTIPKTHFQLVLCLSIVLALLAGVAVGKTGDIGGFGDPEPDPGTPKEKPDKPKPPTEPDKPAEPEIVYPKALQAAIDKYTASLKPSQAAYEAALQNRGKKLAALRNVELPKLQEMLKSEIRLLTKQQPKKAKACASFLTE